METTTLILGAGASMPYGFPSGAELIEDILKTSLDEGASLGHHDLQSVNFRKDLIEARCKSIDHFINVREEYAEIAKDIVSLALLKREDNNELYQTHYESYVCPPQSTAYNLTGLGSKLPYSSAEDWYSLFFGGLEVDELFKLVIITFNYDRSLECFLARFIASRKKLSLEKAFEHIQNMQIYHVHGRLPRLPNEKIRLECGVEIPFADIRRSYKSSYKKIGVDLRTPYEGESFASSYKVAIENSQRVIFLGFGFHELNMNLLGVDFNCLSPELPVYASVYGMNTVDYLNLYKKYPRFILINRTARGIFEHFIEPNPTSLSEEYKRVKKLFPLLHNKRVKTDVVE